MTWVRYDDNVTNHSKVAPLDDATYRMWREAIEWSSHNLTDGVVRARQLAITSVRATKARATKLVAGGLWHVPGTNCDSPKCPPAGDDGWVIHDFWDYQRTAEQVRAEQEANRERQRKWMEKVRASKRKGGTNGEANGATNGVSDGVNNGNPAPPRPAPKGGGDYVPQRQPAASGGVAAAGSGDEKQNPRDSIRCSTCGNAQGSSYHRNVCRGAA